MSPAESNDPSEASRNAVGAYREVKKPRITLRTSKKSAFLNSKSFSGRSESDRPEIWLGIGRMPRQSPTTSDAHHASPGTPVRTWPEPHAPSLPEARGTRSHLEAPSCLRQTPQREVGCGSFFFRATRALGDCRRRGGAGGNAPNLLSLVILQRLRSVRCWVRHGRSGR